MHSFLHKEMSTSIQMKKKFNHEDANYYNFFKLDYYKLDAFNQLGNLPDAYYVKDQK